MQQLESLSHAMSIQLVTTSSQFGYKTILKVKSKKAWVGFPDVKVIMSHLIFLQMSLFGFFCFLRFWWFDLVICFLSPFLKFIYDLCLHFSLFLSWPHVICFFYSTYTFMWQCVLCVYLPTPLYVECDKVSFLSRVWIQKKYMLHTQV